MKIHKNISFNRINQLVSLIGFMMLATFSTCWAMQGYNDPSRLTEQGAQGVYDGSLEVTGANRTDKYFESVGVSTPTTPGTNHSRLWLNNSTKQLCAVYDDGSTGCLTASSLTFLTTSSATATYLQLSSATATYVQISSANATFLTKSSATATYITNSATQESKTLNITSGTIINFTATNSTLSNVSISSMTSTLPMSGRKITGLANGTVATDAAAFGQIHLMQTPQCGTTTGTTLVTASSFTITGLTVAITPTSSSSKIILYMSSLLEVVTGNKFGYATFLRNTTALAGSKGTAGAFTVSGGDTQFPISSVYQDSPATTSSITYAVAIRNTDATTQVVLGDTSLTGTICAFEIQ